MSDYEDLTDRTVCQPGQCCEGYCVGDLLHDLRRDQADRLVEVLAQRDAEVAAKALRDFKAETLPRMAAALGGDHPWVTTAARVARLVGEWLDDSANEIESDR